MMDCYQYKVFYPDFSQKKMKLQAGFRYSHEACWFARAISGAPEYGKSKVVFRGRVYKRFIGGFVA